MVARALRREDLYSGPFVARAPDIAIEMALEKGYGLSLVASRWDDETSTSVSKLGDSELAGGRGLGMNGTHRADGILIGVAAAQPASGEQTPSQPRLRLVDLAPTLLDAMGIPWEATEGKADGKSIPLRPYRYSDEEEAVVAERLRALGYLE